MTMTPRSPKNPEPQKTTTFLRKIRNRADQGLTAQPPELPQLRSLRSRRVTAFPAEGQASISHRPEETPFPPRWDRISTESSTSQFSSSPQLDVFSSRGLPHIATNSSIAPRTSDFPVEATQESDLLPSPLPSLSGSHTATEFDLRISAEPEFPHNSILELQDMRYEIHITSTVVQLTATALLDL
jgi:hypothetical protein